MRAHVLLTFSRARRTLARTRTRRTLANTRMLALVALLACAPAVVSCVLLGLEPVPCSSDADCPRESACNGTTCAPAGEGEGEGGEGEGEGGEGEGGEGEGEGDPLCATSGNGVGVGVCPLFFDQFDRCAIGLVQWANSFDDDEDGPTECSIAERRLRIDISGVVDNYAGIKSLRIDRDGDMMISARLVTAPLLPGSETFFLVQAEGGEKFGFSVFEGELVFHVASETDVILRRPYDEGLHHVLRIRFDGADLLFEGSADGRSFTILDTAPMPTNLTPDFTVVLSGGASVAGGPDVVEWDDVAIESATCLACAASFVDTFDADTLDAQWSPIDAEGLIAVSDGALSLAVDAGSGRRQVDISSEQVNLTNQSVTVRVVVPPQQGASLFIAIGGEAIEIADGFVRAYANSATVPIASVSYDPTAARYLRIRLEDGEELFQLSADGVTFAELDTAPLVFDPTNTVVTIGLFTEDVGVRSAIVDDVVARPNCD